MVPSSREDKYYVITLLHNITHTTLHYYITPVGNGKIYWKNRKSCFRGRRGANEMAAPHFLP